MQNLISPINVIAVGDTECPVDPTQRLRRVIDQRAIRQASVRNQHRLIVPCCHDSDKYLNLFYDTRIALRLNKITDLKRLKKQNHHATGKILQRARKRHTNSKARGGENGHKRSHLDAKYAKRGDIHHDLKQNRRKACEETTKRGVYLCAI